METSGAVILSIVLTLVFSCVIFAVVYFAFLKTECPVCEIVTCDCDSNASEDQDEKTDEDNVQANKEYNSKYKFANFKNPDLVFNNCVFNFLPNAFKNHEEIRTATFNNCTLKNSLWGTFDECTNLKTVIFNNCEFTDMHNIVYTFEDCVNLEKVEFNNSPVKVEKNKVGYASLSSIFKGCSSLGEIDLTMFDTSEMNSVGEIFSGCTNLKKIDLKGWKFNDCGKNDDNGLLFNECYAISELRIDDDQLDIHKDGEIEIKLKDDKTLYTGITKIGDGEDGFMQVEMN